MFLRKSIKLPLYPGYLDLVVTDDIGAYDKVYHKPFGKGPIYGHAIECQTKRDCFVRYIIVLNFNHKTAKISHGVIAHEALHITSFIMDRIDQDFDHNNHEVFCYLIQWITDQVYRFLDRHNLAPLTCK